MPLNRIVALATPLFVAAGGLVSAYLAKYGIHLPADQVIALEVLGATSAGAAALKWLHGHQAYEKSLRALESDAIYASTVVENGVGAVAQAEHPNDPEAATKAKDELIAAAKTEAAKLLSEAQAQAQSLVARAEQQVSAPTVAPVLSAAPPLVPAPTVTS